MSFSVLPRAVVLLSPSVVHMNSAMVVGLVKRRNANLRNAKPRNSQLIKAMFGTVMPRNTKLCNAKLKMRSKNGKLRKLFLLYHARELHLICIIFELMSFRGNTQQMPQESFRAHEAPEDPFCRF